MHHSPRSSSIPSTRRRGTPTSLILLTLVIAAAPACKGEINEPPMERAEARAKATTTASDQDDEKRLAGVRPDEAAIGHAATVSTTAGTAGTTAGTAGTTTRGTGTGTTGGTMPTTL